MGVHKYFLKLFSLILYYQQKKKSTTRRKYFPCFYKKFLAKTKESIFDKPKSFSSGCQIIAILLIHLGDTLTNFLEIQSCCICGGGGGNLEAETHLYFYRARKCSSPIVLCTNYSVLLLILRHTFT